MRVWASLGRVFALARTGFTPGQLSHCTPVSFPDTLGANVLRVFPQAFEYSSQAPRTLKPSLMACTLQAVPDRLSLLGLMPSPQGLGAKCSTPQC